jgi:hypothetical protein
MKKIFFGIIIGLLAGGVGVWIFLRHHDAAHEEKKPEEHKEESHVVHATNGETYLKLDKEAQEHVGLKTAALEAAELKPEVKAFGRVLDPAPLATSMTEIAAARAQFEASARELERLKILHAQNQNVSTRVLETAEVVAQRDRIAANAAQLRFITTWGKAIAGRKDLDAFIHPLISQEAALVRIDVPPMEKIGGAPISARISLLAAPEAPLSAEFTGEAVAADPQTLGRGFLFLLKTDSVAANAAVIGWLSFPGEEDKGVVVPRDAIVRHEGEAFIYIQTGDDRFERKEIELEHPLEKGWFVEAFKPGTKVVIVGAQQLLSEELKGEGGGE